MTNIKFLACMIALLSLTVGTASAQSNIMFILDGSNSMWGQVDGVAKIETAKKVLSGMLLDLPADTKTGLMAYGHTKKEDCTDVQVLAPIGSTDAKGLASMLQGIVPKGKTPITFALEKSFDQFPELEQNNAVVLVSDGLETCGGDPCKTAGELSKKGFNVKKVHVVGFDVNKDERVQLECIATATGGKYFEANSTEGFKTAIAEVKKEVQVVQAKPEPKEVFRDDFNGEELGEHWEVLNPNPDAFIVEDGKLLIISSTPGSLSQGNEENLFRLMEPLPKGDWIVTAKLKIDFQTSVEVFSIGLYQDKDNYIMGNTWAPILFDMPSALYVSSSKRAKGKDKGFEKQVWNDGKRHYPEGTSYPDAMSLIPQPILFQIQKKGRAYFVRLKLENTEKPKWIDVSKLTSLNAKGNLAFGMGQTEATKGESVIKVDWIKVEVPQ